MRRTRSPALKGRPIEGKLLVGPFDEPAEGAHLAGGRRPALCTGLEVFLLGAGEWHEEGRHPLEEAEVEGVLRARRLLLDGVERLLVAEMAVPGGHRALLDL